ALGPGLTVERWPIAAVPVAGGPACIDVVRADLAHHTLRALHAEPARDAQAWQAAESLVAVTNAGMFHADGQPVGLIVAAGAARAAHDLAGALFLEGGPEASRVVHGKDGTLDRVGSYETGFVEDDSNHAYWALPNIIGLAPRPAR